MRTIRQAFHDPSISREMSRQLFPHELSQLFGKAIAFRGQGPFNDREHRDVGERWCRSCNVREFQSYVYPDSIGSESGNGHPFILMHGC